MILAGGNDQAALMTSLREFFNYDVELILVDMASNVIARPYADRFLQISTMDRRAVLEAAKNEGVDYVLTACGDQPLSTMAYVSSQLGLPCYLSEEDVLNLTNKIFMKQKMLEYGIPTSKFIIIDALNTEVNIGDLSFPLIVKPVDSNGSKGVRKALSESDIKRFLDDAFAFSISKRVIIEEFKSGDELSVDVYVEGHEAKILTVTTSKKVKENTDAFTILQSEYPPRFKYSKLKVKEIAQQIVDAFNLKDTPLLIQMIVNNDEYNVVEFSARMGGGSKYHLINILTGVDIMKVYVEMVMGGKPRITIHNKWNNALMSYVYCLPGTYSKLGNFDQMIEQGYMHSYFTYKKEGSYIEKSTTSSDRVAGFLVVGESADEVDSKLKYINNNVHVLDSNGIDIMRHDLYF